MDLCKLPMHFSIMLGEIYSNPVLPTALASPGPIWIQIAFVRLSYCETLEMKLLLNHVLLWPYRCINNYGGTINFITCETMNMKNQWAVKYLMCQWALMDTRHGRVEGSSQAMALEGTSVIITVYHSNYKRECTYKLSKSSYSGRSCVALMLFYSF